MCLCDRWLVWLQNSKCQRSYYTSVFPFERRVVRKATSWMELPADRMQTRVSFRQPPPFPLTYEWYVILFHLLHEWTRSSECIDSDFPRPARQIRDREHVRRLCSLLFAVSLRVFFCWHECKVLCEVDENRLDRVNPNVYSIIRTSNRTKGKTNKQFYKMQKDKKKDLPFVQDFKCEFYILYNQFVFIYFIFFLFSFYSFIIPL